jgi:hypothetical protein
MPRCREPLRDENFDQELARLRLKIDLLPEPQRPHLVELADVIEQHHRRAKKHEHSSDVNR